jgi:hemerythrin-like domain-containing protein
LRLPHSAALRTAAQVFFKIKAKKRLALFPTNVYLESRKIESVCTMKITEILLAEHVVFHNLFDHIERCAPKLRTLAEIKSLASTLETLLRAHSETEDELFVAPLEHCFEQIGQRDTFHEEHDEIDGTLLAVEKARDTKKARQLLLNAVSAARKHFDKEERIVFPLAERTLKADTLKSLGGEWMRRREAALK